MSERCKHCGAGTEAKASTEYGVLCDGCGAAWDPVSVAGGPYAVRALTDSTPNGDGTHTGLVEVALHGGAARPGKTHEMQTMTNAPDARWAERALNVDEMLADLRAVEEQLRNRPPFCTRIDAPGEVLAQLRERFETIRADPRYYGFVDVGISLERDDELPAHHYRVRMSDGTRKLVDVRTGAERVDRERPAGACPHGCPHLAFDCDVFHTCARAT